MGVQHHPLPREVLGEVGLDVHRDLASATSLLTKRGQRMVSAGPQADISG